MLIRGPAPEERSVLGVWEYRSAYHAWNRAAVDFAGPVPRGASGQNRAIVSDPARNLVLLVLGGNEGRAAVYGVRYSKQRGCWPGRETWRLSDRRLKPEVDMQLPLLK